MFKEKFNEIYVLVNAFILKNKKNESFEALSDEIGYYHSIVDEYNDLIFNINNLKIQLEKTTGFEELINNINNLINQLENEFEILKGKSQIVNAYIVELSTIKDKLLFSERLYHFEQSLISQPLNRIDSDQIKILMSYAKIYANNINTGWYYFSNDPYTIDVELGIILPQKNSFGSKDIFLSSIYNYINKLYNNYLILNKDELKSLDLLQKNIHEKLFDFQSLINGYKRNKIIVLNTTTMIDFFNSVNTIEMNINTQLTNIIDLGVLRFTSLLEFFNQVTTESKILINEYKEHALYKEYLLNSEFNKKIEKLQDFIHLLEDGIINIEKSYIHTDTNIKDLVDEIIEMSKESQLQIYYTQKFNNYGIQETLYFEFYQTESFLASIKKYYYVLMTKNIYRYTVIDLNTIGDSTIETVRNKYNILLKKYNQFFSRETDYMNPIEFTEYITQFKELQNKLKNGATLFFNGLLNISPDTYIQNIEIEYNKLQNKLKSDLIYLELKKNNQVILYQSVEKQLAYNYILDITNHLTKIENILILSKKYVFLGMYSTIFKYVYTPFNDLVDQMNSLFNQEKYVAVNDLYSRFYETKIFDFNLLYSLEKLVEKTESLFKIIDTADALFIDMQVLNTYDNKNDDTILILNDLFNDETYKVLRNELFVQLDMFYEFIIKLESSNRVFLTNEKNFKKSLVDNNLMKINYIRWYQKIFVSQKHAKTLDSSLLMRNKWYQQEYKKFQNSNEFSKLESLILNQNKILSMINKKITEYIIDSNFKLNISSDIIKNVDQYNASMDSVNEYINFINKLDYVVTYEELENKKNNLKSEHTESWCNIILENSINTMEKISYNSIDPIQGSIPLTAEFKVQQENMFDATGNIIPASYTWYFDDSTSIDGSKIVHTFYKEGKHIVRCEIHYSTGDVASKYIEFNLTGPQNSQIVKSGTISYSPMDFYVEEPKLTYLDPISNKVITVPVKITGDTTKILDGTSISVDTLTTDLKVENAGLIIFGFEGTEIAGNAFEYSKIYNIGFEYPTENEFLFDFKVSAPVAGIIKININDSKFTTLMSKIPMSISSPYEINDATLFESVGDYIEIQLGDKLIFKNQFNRYSIVDFTSIIENINPSDKKYYYSIGFDYFVNVSLNQYDRNNFKPASTNITVPTIVFKNDTKEIFDSLIVNLEKINGLNEKLSHGVDMETRITIEMEIDSLVKSNKNFYLYTELDRINAKSNSMKQIYDYLCSFHTIDFSKDTDHIEESLMMYENHIINTKSFMEYMNSINAYDFRKNMIDTEILSTLYSDQFKILEILLSTYEYNRYDKQHFIKELVKLENFKDITLDLGLSYGLFLVSLVKTLRDLLFKIKLVINFTLLSDVDTLVLQGDYTRLIFDISTSTWKTEKEEDFYMLNKKLELKYGYEIDKVENNNPYKTFISDITIYLKQNFGPGLSTSEINALSAYIQTVEEKAVTEYDSYFMFPYWVDYLEKNVK